MKIKKIKNLGINVFYGFIYKIMSIVFPFIIRTILIKTLSAEYLGLSSLFSSILQALNLVELGFGSAAVFNMYDPVAKGDNSRLSAYMNFYKKCYRMIGLFILILGLIILPFIKYFINGDVPDGINLTYIYLIYLSNTVLNYWVFAYKNSIALAYQRTDIESKSLIISNLLMYILQIIILFIYKNYYYYIILLPVFTVVKNLFISFFVSRKYSDVIPKGDISREDKKNITSNIKNLFGHQIAFTVINSLDSIILSSILGLYDLAIYNNYYYILLALHNFLGVIFTSIQAGIGNDIITSSTDVVYNNFKHFRFLIFTISYFSAMLMFALYQPFMKIWMGEELMLSNAAVYVFVLGFYINQIRKVVTTYKNAAGLWKSDFLKPYVVITVDLIIDLILVKNIGSIGAMISTIVSMSIVAIPWETRVLYRKIFNRSSIEHFISILKECLMIVTTIPFIIYFVSLVNAGGILGLIYIAVITIVTSLVIFVIFNIKNSEIRWTLDRIKKFIKYME